MCIFRLIGFVVLFCDHLISVSGELKCDKNQYKDGATNICMPCSACCPPRPQNQFCKKGCDLDNACKMPEKNPNPHLEIWQIFLIALSTLLAITIAVVVVIYRKKIGKRLRRICTKMKGVPDTNPDDPRQLQVIGCHELDSAPTMNGQTKPLIDNNPYVIETSHEKPSHNKFYSIPSSHLQNQNRGSTLYTSLPIPQYLERNGIKFIREDIVKTFSNVSHIEAQLQLQANLNRRDSNEANGLWPSMPHGNHSGTIPQSNGDMASMTPEEDRRSMIKSVQCAEDLEDHRPSDIHPCETPVKT